MNSLVDLAAVMIPIIGSIVLFAFLSVVGWARQKRRERETFYRHEVLKKLIEQGGAGGQQVFEMMRREAELQDRQRREARILGGLITAVIGASVMILLYLLVPVGGVWTAGLIPFSVGAVILLFAFFTPKTT
jgi:hypothetical protein